MLNFESEPYHDDYNEDNKFYRILFRPSFAVQGRELTQLQSILQNQIKRHGDSIFKQGAMVIPGQLSTDNNYHYVKLQPLFGGVGVETFISNFIGKRILGTSGIQAEVLGIANAVDADPTTLYVRYITSGTDGIVRVFADSEVITTEDTLYSVTAAASLSTGIGSAAIIKRGVYYVNGFFVLCEDQTIILDKYTNTPSYRIGLTVDEVNVTPEDDETLLDNAQNSYNYAAPGAHRYFIDLVLSKLAINSVEDINFIELSRIVDGVVLKQVRATEYSVLETSLARRTYDESGNYTVRQFEIDVREHRNNNTGQWVTATSYNIGDIVTNAGFIYVAKNTGTSVTTAPTHLTGTAYDGPGVTGIKWEYNQFPDYNRGIYLPSAGGDETKLAIGLEPGKAYVQGYEIEKISTEYLSINKARESIQNVNSLISATLGNYVLVNNINSLPKFDTFETVTLYNYMTATSIGSGRGTLPAGATIVGTCRIRGIEWHSGTPDAITGVYKLFVFDVKMNSGYDFNRDVKSFYWANGGALLNFTADVEPVTKQLIGSISSAAAVITGVGTSFQTDLKVGDHVMVGTQKRRVTVITSQLEITVSTAPSPALVGDVISRITTEISEPQGASLLFPLPYNVIKSVRSAINVNTTTYTIMERFTGTSTGGSALTLTTASGTFASAAETDNYTAVDNTTGAVVTPTSITPAGSSVTLQFASAVSHGFYVTAAVNKTGASLTEKTKTLNTGTITFTTAATSNATTLSLGKADCCRIVSVKMKTGSFSSPGATYSIDISDRYTFDNGQRDSFYDYGRLLLISSFTPPSAPIEVVFEYFSHSSGDYFTVNSYPANISYSDIYSFGDKSLRDVIDFRPRIDDTGANFTGTGASTTNMPKRGLDIRADFSYYLGRNDKIYIDYLGKFFNITGVSSLTPGTPLDPSLGMVLYTLELDPYNFKIDSVNIIKTDNKRYTMRDIGKLENRINNLEYYTSLSLLEQSTESLSIPDVNGIDRFKNGFIVDNFTGHNIGDTSSKDYICSIDMEKKELRPFYSMQNVNLIEKNSNNTQRNSSNYKLYGDVITLPVLEHRSLITQNYASRVEFVNPYASFTFIGEVKINPSSDDWFEVNRLPDIITNVEGNFNAIRTLAAAAGVLGSVWNSWQVIWTGRATTSRVSIREGIESFRNRNFNVRSRQVKSKRTGINTTVIAKIDTQVIDDRVVSTAVIPYMRSRYLLVKVKGLKPSTSFYAYFDNVDVSWLCNAPIKLSYTPTAGEFDDSTNIGGLATETARRVYDDSQVCLNIGDVVTGSTSGATGVVVGKEVEGGIYSLYISNNTNTPFTVETITGSLSGATGVVTNVVYPDWVFYDNDMIGITNLKTNANGELSFLFRIINEDWLRFRCGTKEFKLQDVTTVDGIFTSKGRTNYTANGIIQNKQATIVATRNANVVSTAVTENKTVTEILSVTAAQYYDPLAQTFLIDIEGGCFLSKVDLFFATKDTNIPVSIEIREVVNGYPGKRVLPFSRVTLNPDKIQLSGTNVTVDGISYPSFDTPTTFTFESPVYVQDNTEYCLVIMSDSNVPRVWISQIGDVIPGSLRTISEQPYAGVFFKSQNASTWTANQLQDLKFTIYRAVFDTAVVSNVQFVNDVIPKRLIEKDPFQTKDGTNVVRVWHRDHGMSVSSSVAIRDARIFNPPPVGFYAQQTIETLYDAPTPGAYLPVYATSTTGLYCIYGTGTITSSAASTTVYGTGTVFLTTFGSGTTSAGTVICVGNSVIGVIASVTDDTTITLAANASVTITPTTNYTYAFPLNGIPVHEIFKTHVISNVDFDNYTITVTSNANVDGYMGGEITAAGNYQYDTFHPQIQIQTFPETTSNFSMKTTSGKSMDGSQTPYIIDVNYSDCLANENNSLFNPAVVASETNEIASMSGNKSATFVVQMSSTNDSLSPIIDTHRLSLTTISNKINAPTEANTNVVALDNIVLFTGATGTYTFAGSTITSTNATVRPLMRSISVGQYIIVSGATTGANDGTYLVSGNIDNGTTGTITLVDASFTGEAAAAGTTITRKELFYDEITPIGSSSVSKYVSKDIKVTNPSTFIRIRVALNVPSEADILMYYKINAVGSVNTFDKTIWTLLNPDSTLTKVENGNETFTDTDYSISNLPLFDSITIKIVMNSTNSSAVPRVKDLRIIVCA